MAEAPPTEPPPLAAKPARTARRQANPRKRRVRVAIVGGGCAGLSAAWHLTALNADKAHPARYEVTVYDSKPHLGGKGASTRDDQGRILEHGLHIWLGFYENAFRMMRDCYAEVEGSPTIGPGKTQPLFHGSFDDAFFPEPQIGLASQSATGSWAAWTGWFPPMPGLPGDDLVRADNPFTLAGYLRRALGLVKMLIQSELAPPSGEGPERSPLDEAMDVTSTFDLRESPAVLVDRMARLLRVGALASAAGWLQGVTMLDTLLQQEAALPFANLRLLKFVQALAVQWRRLLRQVVNIDPALRRKTEIIDLVMTITVGLFRDKVMLDPRGLDVLDGVDCRKWLLRHGATSDSLESPFVKGLYDLAFAYPNGDKRQPSLAAGQALRGALRMFFTYRGAMFWRMRSGMGEVVFAPLYRVLKKRGVDFRLMHTLKKTTFAPVPERPGALRIKSLVFDVDGYSERIAARDALDPTGCWPEDKTVRFRKIGARTTLERLDEKHFEAVVMATGPAVLKATCPDLQALPRWQRMCEEVQTVATQTAQFWLRPSLRELGWKRGPVVLSGYCPPFDTWADMTHALGAEERWRALSVKPVESAARSLAYFCSATADGTSDSDVSRRAVDFLSKEAAGLWPDIRQQLEKGLLVGKSGAVENGLSLAGQHFRAHASREGTDRYTLALPGTLEFRISPLDESVVNMTIAGDWTNCGFNEGCIEAAVMSGMLACHAISGRPELEDIVGYHHP